MDSIYKELEPDESVHNMRKVLSDIGLVTRETLWEQPFDDVYSCKVEIIGSGLSSFGKGISVAYCLASAYGELIEEIQTNVLFASVCLSNTIERKFDFYIDPDENRITSLNNQSLPEIFKLSKPFRDEYSLYEYWNDNFMTCNNSLNMVKLPFCDILNQEVIYLPYGIILLSNGSNGICAGNTKEEALVHGFSEIFERYATKKIFFEKIYVPVVKKKTLRKFFPREYQIIENIEREGKYSIVVKDCTLHGAVPVMGIIVMDKDKRSYCVNLGADPDLRIALQRCITEVFQGGVIFKDWKSSDISFNYDKYDVHEEYNKQIKNGSGTWPYQFIVSNMEIEIYKHKIYNSILDKYNYLLACYKKMGVKSVYIRDCTFSKIFSYQIVIPGFSEVFTLPDYYKQANIFFDKLVILRKITTCSDEELLLLANDMEISLEYKFYGSHNFVQDYIGIMFDHELWDELPLEGLLFIIYFKLNKVKKAKKWLMKYIDILKHNKEEMQIKKDFFICIYDGIILNEKISDFMLISKILSQFYQQEIIEDVVEVLTNKNTLFDQIENIDCFDCDFCEKENCNFKYISDAYLRTKKFIKNYKSCK